MKHWNTRVPPLLLALALLAGMLFAPAQAAVSAADIDAAVADVAAYVKRTVSKPKVASIGGEWAVLGLARSGYEVPESYYQEYYAEVEKTVQAKKGVLYDRKYTEYARVILALSAIGKDARNVADYDLTVPLGDFDKTVWQGLNGPIWALIALDSAGYPMPENKNAKTQATRQMYVDYILDRQLRDGGWSLDGTGTSDPDITGMALQALAGYQDQPEVEEAIEKALACMSGQQDKTGGFSSWGTPNLESCAQMVVALASLGLPMDDPRFVKEGNSLLDNLMTFYVKGKGFQHTKGGGTDGMATEQGLYALVAVQRAQQGKARLYLMSDALFLPDSVSSKPAGEGLEGKDPAVRPMPVTGIRNFPDITQSSAASAIQALASREIIDGKSDGRFDPEGSITRAEFAAIVVRALGLEAEATDAFSDVPAGEWYAGYVGTASGYGIVTGGGDGTFRPQGTLTRQEAAVMVSRAAKLCGVDTAMEAGAVRNMLAQFPDYIQSAQWAREALAVCYREGILSQNDLDIRPLTPITRAEVAQMLYNLLGRAELL